MRIDIITIFPELLETIFSTSILKRAQTKKIVEIQIHNLRDYTHDKHKTVDDMAYGGGAGMVMKIEPIAKCMEKLKSEREYNEIIFMTPDGETLQQKTSNQLSGLDNLMILCGHYKGIDERIRQLYITKEISIGDYVLTGGELPAAILCDSIIRLIPSVLEDSTSALSDSFQDGLLSPPIYTRPENFKGLKVPSILLSGNDKKIEEWRLDRSIEKTKQLRPDMLKDI